MLKIEFTTQELDDIKAKIHFTPRQLRVIDYRRDEISIVKMADLEHCDPSTINREIKDIKRKIKKVIWPSFFMPFYMTFLCLFFEIFESQI